MDGPDYLPRDFLETREGLFFAVVATGTEDGRVPAFLRYVREGATLRKLDTLRAAALIARDWPEYLLESASRDVEIHGVPPSRIERHHRPAVRAQGLLSSRSADPLEQKAIAVLSLFLGAGVPATCLGVTGSLLIHAHNPGSDIDLVVYERSAFLRARDVIRDQIANGRFEPLGDSDWRAAFERRACSLSFDDYCWHERRKHNKLMIGGTKVDVSLIIPEAEAPVRWKKTFRVEVRTRITDDSAAFDYPARYTVDDPEIHELVSYTSTYTGQARTGETVLAAGWIEESHRGERRLLIGTSREAAGEFIRVVRD